MRDILTKARETIAESDALLIGASNGLSIAEGYNIFADNEMFRQQFGDFRSAYGIRSVLEGCFHRYSDAAAGKAFLKRLVQLWVRNYRPTRVMTDLLGLVGRKEYFVVTSNGDTHLELSGFAPERVFEIEGTFELWLAGAPIADRSAELAEFVERYGNSRLVMLDLGIGSRNQLIKAPMMRLCTRLPRASYITLNLPHEISICGSIVDRSLALPGDIAVTLDNLLHA
ncbi:MAG: hypothetical protein Q4F72_11645 [Desulfovibrionaceae bacterium]|nr:hypothetical protein [Desulfovibrionaceae bacterium]